MTSTTAHAPETETLVEDDPGRSALDRAGDENFTVASLLVGRKLGAHLLAIYGYARYVDELGDSAPGDRLRQLDAFESSLDDLFAGADPAHPILRRLAPTREQFDLPDGPFRRLIEANRQDQLVTRYGTFSDLVAYCTLSANPVGELVLHLFGAATPERVALSDRVCTALQLAEHWQDVREDHAAGRIYLPTEDMERFGVTADELGAESASPALRALMAFEVTRAREWIDLGAPLVGTLTGRARIAVAGFVGGGRAALDAIESAELDVLGSTPVAAKSRRIAATLRTWRKGA